MLIRNIILISFFLINLFFLPLTINSAEVLQVRTSSLLQIGDSNRSYTVKLACLEIDPLQEEDVRNLLRSELPRGTKVNLKPQGSIDGILLARVITLNTEVEMAKLVEENLLGRNTCTD